MSIYTTWEKLNTLHATVSGVVKVSTSFPDTINSADMPLVMTIPGSAEWNPHAVGGPMGGLNRQKRTYTVRCYIKPEAQDISPDPWIQKAMVLIQRFGAAYLDHWSLDGVIDQFDSVADSGLRDNLPGGSAAYCGFEFTLVTVEKSTST